MIRFDLFELLQIAVGNRETFSCKLTEDRWSQLLEACISHALDGIGFAACRKLNKDACPPKPLLMQWAGQAITIEDGNRRLLKICDKLTSKLSAEGFYSCILKGQSNLVNYPEELRLLRTPGDIDVWVSPKTGVDGQKAVVDYVRNEFRLENSSKDVEVLYHHVDWSFKGVQTELHYRLSWLNNPFANFRLQRWSKEHHQWDVREYEGFPIPTASFNVVYQLVHINRHLFNEGIGLRQLLDYYFVLKSYHEESDTESRDAIMHTLKSFNLGKFAGAVMYVLQMVFAMPDEYLLCAPRIKEGEFLLDEILMAGNFGQYDARNPIRADEGYISRFVRRQRRFLRFLTQYPGEVLWGPVFSVSQRCYRWLHGYK